MWLQTFSGRCDFSSKCTTALRGILNDFQSHSFDNMMSLFAKIFLQYDPFRHFNLRYFYLRWVWTKCLWNEKTINLKVVLSWRWGKHLVQMTNSTVVKNSNHFVPKIWNFQTANSRRRITETCTFPKRMRVACNPKRLSISQIVSGLETRGTNLQFYFFFMSFFHLEYYTICMLPCFDVIYKAVLIPLCDTRPLYIGHKWVLKRMAHANMRPQTQITFFLPPKFHLLNTDE